jgi:hypothetical protein
MTKPLKLSFYDSEALKFATKATEYHIKAATGETRKTYFRLLAKISEGKIQPLNNDERTLLIWLLELGRFRTEQTAMEIRAVFKTVSAETIFANVECHAHFLKNLIKRLNS